MSHPFHKTKEFISLNKEWSKKLKDSGFQDIERTEDVLISYNGTKIIARSRDGLGGTNAKDKIITMNKSKEVYYRLAGQFLYSHKFDNEEEKSIWSTHSEGVSLRGIAESLRGEKKWNKDNINAVITRLSKQMLLDFKKEVDEDE